MTDTRTLVPALEEVYWSLVLMPATLIAMLAWIDRIRSRPRAVVTTALALLLIATQPARAQMASSLRLPQYRPIVTACQSVARRNVVVRGMQTTFEVPSDAKPEWLCALAGATIRADETAPLTTIRPDGGVIYR